MSLRDIEVPTKDEPLSEDVRLLGELVGDVIREQGGEDLYARVEAARRAAIGRREGDPSAHSALFDAVEGLEASDVEELVRGFSTYFQVVNLAERVHRVRRGRAYLRQGAQPQAQSFADTTARLKAAGLDGPAAAAIYQAVRVEPVFTAHPTEATRRIILEKQERIAEALIGRLNPERTAREERVALALVRENVTAAWQTEEHPAQRPTVADEREHVLYYVSGVLYKILPRLYEALHESLRAAYGREPDMPSDLVRFASWVGGDMDGNPNVTADTLRATLERHRAAALGLYQREVAGLARQLSQSASRVEWSEDLSARTRAYDAANPGVVAALPQRHREMGYRVFFELVRARLADSVAGGPHAYANAADFAGDVQCALDSLAAHRGRHAGLFAVRRLLFRVRTFGFHLAALDVRQDAREIRDALSELFDDPAWPRRPAVERAERLRARISDLTEPLPAPAAGTRGARLLEVFAAMRAGRERFGPQALGVFIISMAQGVDDVLSVLYLARRAGLVEGAEVPLDVVPLLETVNDLARAQEVLAAIFTDPIVRPHLAARDQRQTVMVGYSDSGKDGGILAARWALHDALERMAAAATTHDIRLTVFHGRGGSVSRGGGNVGRAVHSMPAAAVSGRLRLTEQGEVIDANYGVPPIALRSLERMVGAVALKTAGVTEEAPVPDAWRAALRTAAAKARVAYRTLVYDNPQFVPYFRGATPIDVIERLAIGSRPASRRAGQGVEDLRAIPWVFSWTQCRAMLPGWFGLGSGLLAAASEVGWGTLAEAARSWPFLRALLNDVEMVLAKADLGIAAQYRELAPPESRYVYAQIETEYERTVEAVLALSGSAALLDRDPTLQRSIRLRNPYVDPMSMLQVDLLRRWREGARADPALERALFATVHGIARGLQNTG